MSTTQIPPFPMRDQSRWDKKVNKTDSCWFWIAGTNKRGYGTFRIGKRVYLAHRVAYVQAKGQIPDDLIIRHKCPGVHNKETRRCVNPDHLEPGTDADNGADKRACGSGRGRVSGTRNGRSKLTPEMVLEIYNSDLPSAELSESYEVSVGQINNIKRGHSWGHLGLVAKPISPRVPSKKEINPGTPQDSDLIPSNRDIKRFWKYVDKTDGCWLWTAGTQDGYGAFRCQNRTRSAHRVSFIIAGGKVDPSLDIAHTCANRLCVRPDHLEQKTRAANMANRETRRRISAANKNNQGNQRLTDEQIRYIKERFRDDPEVLAPQIAKELGNIVTSAAIANIRKGKTGRNVVVEGFQPRLMDPAWRKGRSIQAV